MAKNKPSTMEEVIELCYGKIYDYNDSYVKVPFDYKMLNSNMEVKNVKNSNLANAPQQ